MQREPLIRRQASSSVANTEPSLLSVVDTLNVDVAEQVVRIIAHGVIEQPKQDEGQHRHD